MARIIQKSFNRVDVFTAFFLILSILFLSFLQSFDVSKIREKAFRYQGDVVVSDQTDRGINLIVTRIAEEDYDDYDIEPYAVSAFTITATVTDSDGNTPADIQKVTYSIAWRHSNALISSYVTMTQNGTTATFSCIKAFDAQIVVTCASILDPTKQATATLDYYKRISNVAQQTSMTITNGDVLDIEIGKQLAVWQNRSFSFCKLDFNFGTGTIMPDISLSNCVIELNSDIVTALNNSGSNYKFSYKSPMFISSAPGAATFETVMNGVLNVNASGGFQTSVYFKELIEAIESTSNHLKVTVNYKTSYGTDRIVYQINLVTN